MDQRGVDYKNLEKFGDVKNDWLMVKGNFGPELGFGHVMGHVLDEPVLVLKACIGNRSLGWDLLPPGSERYEFEGKVYAGYKDIAPSWDKGAEPKAVPWYAGRQYDADTAHAKAVLKNLKKYYPDYNDQGYEVAGFVWWQGHKDTGSAAHANKYEENLVRLVHSLRKDFDAPKARFVLATGCGNPGTEGLGKKIAEAQLALADEKKHPEFKGSVRAVDTRNLWREAADSPTNQGYHYNHNAETYMETGLRLGWAMAELLKGDGK
jgi:alpha-galactosidase